MPKRIQMSWQHPWRADNPDAIIVARPSRWGNPYRIGETGWNYYYPDAVATRTDTVLMFLADLRLSGVLFGDDTYITEEDVRRELRGKDLACWCPLDVDCHADILLRVANDECSATERSPGWHTSAEGDFCPAHHPNEPEHKS